MSKKNVVSKCCDSKVHFIPPSLGEPGMYFCSKCNSFCEVKLEVIKDEDKK